MMGRPRLNLIGQKFGRLTVIAFAGIAKCGQSSWECLCDCGNKKIVKSDHLRRGNTKSCGCLRKITTANRHLTHGMSHSRIYKRWIGMIKRCYNQNESNYKDYGGRGIIVCERWINSFENFFKDMGSTYKDNLQLDRINNNGNYEPGNVRWATPKENSNNRRNSKHDSPKITTTP
jgi:hypothetical protein